MKGLALSKIILLFGICITIFSIGFDFRENYGAFAQTDIGNGPNPGDNNPSDNNPADIGTGPIPEDNSTFDNNTADIGTGPIPEDNSTGGFGGLGSPGDFSVQNNTAIGPEQTVPSVSSDLGNPVENNTAGSVTSQVNGSGGNAVPEFGPLPGLILGASIVAALWIGQRTFLKFYR